MSSDGYFEDDDFDDAAFEQLDAIEAAHSRPPIPQEPSFDEDVFDSFGDIDPDEFEKLDTFIVDSYQGKAQPVAGPSRTGRGTRQTTLDGQILPLSPTKAPRTQVQRTNSAPRPLNHKTKKWDQTAFAKSGNRKRGGRNARDEEDEEGEPVEFEQFPAPFVSRMLFSS